MKKHIISIFLIFTLFSFGIFAEIEGDEDKANDRPWHLLEMGKLKMEEGEFGDALNYVNYARQVHELEMKKKYDCLFNAIKPKRVKKEGDSIFAVYSILKERENYDACKVMDEIFLTHPPVFFDKSMEKLMSWLKKRILFPETDFLTGKIFFAEGEYKQAMLYYKKAWDNRALLEIPDERFTIIYAMADTAKLLRQYDEEEKYLLLVLTEDPIYGTTNLESPTLQAMINTIDKEKSVEKFFLLYRHKKQIALKAYLDLTKIYMNAGKYQRALTTSALSAIIIISNLDKEISKTDYEYSYKNLSQLLNQLHRKSIICNWAEENGFWKGLIDFADCLKICGKKKQALDLYSKLSQSLPSIKYAQEAAYKAKDK